MADDLSRRRFLTRGTAVGASTLAGIAIGVAGSNAVSGPGAEATEPSLTPPAPAGGKTVNFFGSRQAGVDTPPQAHLALIALDFRPGANRDSAIRLMRLWCDDAQRLTTGRPALADLAEELAAEPARLTVTVGWGPGFFDVAGLAPAFRPAWLRPLPAFAVDKLEERWSGGDVVLQICSDDPMAVAHATRVLVQGARTIVSVRWIQRGFRRAWGMASVRATARNLMGQLDGTRNVAPWRNPELVWSDGSDGWLDGGTSMVVRRIAMDLTGWEQVDRAGREAAIGRRLDTGAPLTGKKETDEPDLERRGADGAPVIAEDAHIRRARTGKDHEQMLRRVYNYDDRVGGGEANATGVVFITFQADVDRQYVPVQRKLDEMDRLGRWTTPIGSAVFAVPPGCTGRRFWGQELFD